MSGRYQAFTLIELLAALLVLAVLLAIGLPIVARTHGHMACAQAARRFALVVRNAQAVAQADGCRIRVKLIDDGHGYEVTRAGETSEPQTGGNFAGSRCATNYPGAAVDFGPAGWPLAGGSNTPRAGTFTFTHGTGRGTVVVQLGGRVRCR